MNPAPHLQLQQHSTHYILELKLKEDKKKWYVYAQGISPLFYNLKGIHSFHIYRQWFTGTEFQKKEITWRISQFQDLFRNHLRFKKLVIRNLRKLETGEFTWSQLLNRK